jgi:cation:H+ antiporter
MPQLERSMPTVINIVIFLAGLGVLYIGAETMLKGSVRLARSFGISPLVIGLTLVAFGTSAPELSLDLTAAFRGKTDLAFGDLVGSNIANVGLIMGVAAVIRPLSVQMRLLRFEVPVVIATSLGLWGLTADGTLGRIDAAILLAAFVGFLLFTYRSARREPAAVKEEFEHLVQDGSKRWINAALVLGGLVGLVVGAQLMVYAAVEIARQFGVSELVIGLTVVAIGTSLPELATSVVGAWRGESDIVVGNVLGSNIFNILLIMSAVALVQPLHIEASSWKVDVPVMIAFSAALVPIMLHLFKVTRGEGILPVIGYVAFLCWQANR